MNIGDFSVVYSDAAVPLPVIRAERGWRGALAAFYRGLMKVWVGLYAPTPRHMPPMV